MPNKMYNLIGINPISINPNPLPIFPPIPHLPPPLLLKLLIQISQPNKHFKLCLLITTKMFIQLYIGLNLVFVEGFCTTMNVVEGWGEFYLFVGYDQAVQVGRQLPGLQA